MKKIILSFLAISIVNLKSQAQVVGLNDASFNPGSGANATITHVNVQPDGKIIACGTFSAFNSVAKSRLVRLNSNGSIDATFGQTGTGFNNSVYTAKYLSNGKILAVGQFTKYNSNLPKRAARLNSNGTFDNTFSSNGANDFIYNFSEQPDGKIIVGGGFTSYGGVAKNRIARISAVGGVDATFNVGTGANNAIYAISIQSDGKVIIGGLFTTYNGTSKVRLARLNTNGSADASFFTGTGITVTTGTNAAVYSTVVQSDGKILVGGLFTKYNGTTANNLVRLNADGTIDNTFSSTGTNNYIRSINIQSDGKIIVSGAFTTCNGVAKSRIVRLNSNGSIDNTFNGTGANNTIVSSELQSDGNLIISGDFTSYSGDLRSKIARVNTICPTPTVTLVGQTDNVCNGSSIGSATVSAIGGSTFTYTWLPAGGNTAIATGLSAGTYTCIVNNECLNSATSTVTIMSPIAVSLLTGASSTICNSSNASLTANASGGTGAFTYTWMPGNLIGDAQTVTPSVNTTYTVTATDANGCTASSSQIVDIYALPTLSISGGTATICSGSTATLTAAGANTYLWNTGANTAATMVTPATTTTYTVTGTDVNGCSNTASETVTVSGVCAVSSLPCGKIITNLNLSLSAMNVIGATQYRFKFYNNITNALVATKIQATSTLTFNTVSGIYYDNTYKWTVAVDKGPGFGSESNNACTIIFSAPKTTVPCGYSHNNLNSYSYCNPISGATGYRFSFYNNSTNALVAAKAQTSNNIYFNTVPGLAYGQTYKWTVEVLYNNGTTSLWGPASSSLCTVAFNAPQTILPCGNTYTSTTAYVGVGSVLGATAYRFTFYDAATGALVAVKTNGTNYVYFNQVPGLIYNKTYKWTVEVQYNNGTSNVYGPASSNTCTMTWGAPSSIVLNGTDGSARLAKQESSVSEESVLIKLYPNPVKDNLYIESTEAIDAVKIYNVSGELVLEKNNNDIKKINVCELKTGVYFIYIQTGKELKHFQIVKE